MMTKGQGLGFLGAGLLFLLGVSLLSSNPQPGNLHYSSLGFLFVGLALFAGTLTSWLNERHHRTSLLAVGVGISLLFFLIALIFGIWSYFY
jgi:hypothetical protein